MLQNLFRGLCWLLTRTALLGPGRVARSAPLCTVAALGATVGIVVQAFCWLRSGTRISILRLHGPIPV